MRLYQDKSANEIWEINREGVRSTLTRLGITADNAADYPNGAPALIATGFSAEVQSSDQFGLLAEIAGNEGLEVKELTADEVWSEKSWDSID